MRNNPSVLIGVALALLLMTITATNSARAEVLLRFSPADTSVSVDDTASLAILLDDTLDVRTVEVWIQYDPDVVTSIGGEPGQLFYDTGADLFDGFEEEIPGQWHGYAVVLDAYSWATGPGELYVWHFTADEVGVSPVLTANVRLFNPDATLIDDVALDDTSIIVFDPTVTVPEVTPQLPRLELYPNPFNPRTELYFDLPELGPAHIDVFDSRGRKVSTAWQGWYNGGRQNVTWEGRDADGRQLPSGVYLFRLVGAPGVHTLARGILIK